MRSAIRRLTVAFVAVLALVGVPCFVVTATVPAVIHANVCDDAQANDCPDSTCSPDDCAEPPPPAPVVVPVPVPRPGVDACVNLGGRRRVSVSGCI